MRKRSKFGSAPSLSGVVTLNRTRDRFKSSKRIPYAAKKFPARMEFEKKFCEWKSAELPEATFYPRVTAFFSRILTRHAQWTKEMAKSKASFERSFYHSGVENN